MSGFQEILLIVFIIVAIMFVPRMTARPPAATPSRRRLAARMDGKMRLAVAVCAIYMAAAAAYFQPWRRDPLLFVCIGVGPVALAGIVAWVVAGFRKQ